MYQAGRQYYLMIEMTGLEIATDTIANATNIFSLATKNCVFSRHFGEQISL